MSVARFFVLALLLGTPGVARDRHVSAATDHVNCGTTPATTFRMPQKAESVVQPGDFVLIGNGVYGEDSSQRGEGSALLLIRKSGLPGAWITWKARPGHTPLLRPRQRRLGHPHLPHVARRTSHVDIVNNTTYWNGSVSGYEELFPNRSTDIAILNNIFVLRPGGQVTSDNRNTGSCGITICNRWPSRCVEVRTISPPIRGSSRLPRSAARRLPVGEG